MKTEELKFKKDSIEVVKKVGKKKVGRPKGVKNGQGKKKIAKKKVKTSKKTANRSSRLRPKEREKFTQLVVKHFGATYVGERIGKYSSKKEKDEELLRIKSLMEKQVEDEKIEVKEYYKKIDAEYRTVGRPRSVFTDKEVRYLCSIGCSCLEIAGFFGMCERVLKRKIKEEYGINWSQFYEQNSQGVKISLRRAQIQNALEGDTQMQKFLGINMLGQKNKVEFEGEVKVNSFVDLVNNVRRDNPNEVSGDDAES